MSTSTNQQPHFRLTFACMVYDGLEGEGSFKPRLAVLNLVLQL